MAEADLPEEVMIDIMSWLPVKSLIRFTSVSKRWRFIILSYPKFAASQFKAARQRKTLDRRLIFSTDAPQLESIDFDATPSHRRKLTYPFEIPTRQAGSDSDDYDGQPADSHGRLLGSCNGLVFVAFDDYFFYIWNPSTRVFMQFPEPAFFFSRHLVFYGAGYLSATNDYKVFAAAYDLEEEMEEIKIYSLRAQEWKAIRNPEVEAHGKGTLLNETLHWVKQNEILAFDFAHEEFNTMRLPDIAQRRRDQKFRSLGVSGGYLCVCSSLKDEDGYGCVDLWVMREYGNYDSWTNYAYSSPDRLGLYLRFLVMESCTVAVKKGGDQTRILLVKIDHEQEKKVGMYMNQGWWHYGFDIIPYEESLLWINDL